MNAGLWFLFWCSVVVVAILVLSLGFGVVLALYYLVQRLQAGQGKGWMSYEELRRRGGRR